MESHDHEPNTNGSSNPISSSSPSSSDANPTSRPLIEPQQDLDVFLESFWSRQMEGVEQEEMEGSRGASSLPLARIKKVMKSDEEVKVGSSSGARVIWQRGDLGVEEWREKGR